METAVLTALASLEAHKEAVLATSVSGEFTRIPIVSSGFMSSSTISCSISRSNGSKP
jgi:hypothetical protein